MKRRLSDLPESELPMVIEGRETIAELLRCRKEDIPRLAREEGLKAWKTSEKGKWLLMSRDAIAFLQSRRDAGCSTALSSAILGPNGDPIEP